MKLHGLINFGNICYLNSALQVLYSIDPLRNYLLNGEYKKDINKTNKMGHEGKYIETMAEFFSNYSHGQPNTNNLLNLLSNSFPFGEQHDSHEILIHLIDYMHEDVIHNGNSVVHDIFYGEVESTIMCSHCVYQSKTNSNFNCLELDIPKRTTCYSDIDSASLMNDVLVGIKGFANNKLIGSEIYIYLPRVTTASRLYKLIASILHLEPTDISKIFITRNHLRREIFKNEIIRLTDAQVEIHSERKKLTMFSDKSMSVIDALRQYFKPEQMEEWKCEECHNVGGKKYLNFKTFPKYFIMSVKLFEMGYYGCVKKTDYLTFPDRFESQNIVSSFPSYTYEIVSVINHIGYSFFGHYYSYVKCDDKWYCCNDETVSEVPQSDIHQKEAYVVIYKQIN
ncbi:hypothetical protein ENUP19_0367G0015 [Entamoeba nuttalli]|uniref:ubiquitinyl hydrolase 1 n=1 Tax=Entamoeba nuttalli TaxID=412467 RepID=A0ABQ0DYQ0_9EUKA